jgi:hypothetical protein
VLGDVTLRALKLGETSIRTTVVGVETQNCTLMCVGFGMYAMCVCVYVCVYNTFTCVYMYV